ncbi:MAG: translation initiation factor IF-1 [Candidatus Gracilibacteria bacterium]
MPKGNKIEVDGVVTEILPGAQFTIKITDPNYPENFIIRGYISGKMRMNYIRIIPGDRVKVELEPYDITKGRITYRYK